MYRVSGGVMLFYLLTSSLYVVHMRRVSSRREHTPSTISDIVVGTQASMGATERTVEREIMQNL